MHSYILGCVKGIKHTVTTAKNANKDINHPHLWRSPKNMWETQVFCQVVLYIVIPHEEMCPLHVSHRYLVAVDSHSAANRERVPF